MKNDNVLNELRGYKQTYDTARTKYEMAKGRIKELESKLKALNVDPDKLDSEIKRLTGIRDARKVKFESIMSEIRKNVQGIQ